MGYVIINNYNYVKKSFFCFFFSTLFYLLFFLNGVLGQNEARNAISVGEADSVTNTVSAPFTNETSRNYLRLNDDTNIVGLIHDEEKSIPESGVMKFNSTLNRSTPPPPTFPPVDEVRRRWPRCPMTCEQGWMNDNYCDEECNIPECNYDDGDCDGWCSPGCRAGWQNDTDCDITCYKKECNWDSGSCSHLDELRMLIEEKEVVHNNTTSANSSSDSHFLSSSQKNSTSSLIRSTATATPISKPFNYTLCKCSTEKIGNGKCDEECNTYECNLDGRDCKHDCTLKCPYIFLGDGECDRDCDVKECNMDKGDCFDCAEGCRAWKLDNGFCDNECDNPECNYDYGDCENVARVEILDYDAKPDVVYLACFKDFIGDTCCNPECYNEESDWDGGDCGPPPPANATDLSINITSLLEMEYQGECLNVTLFHLSISKPHLFKIHENLTNNCNE